MKEPAIQSAPFLFFADVAGQGRRLRLLPMVELRALRRPGAALVKHLPSAWPVMLPQWLACLWVCGHAGEVNVRLSELFTHCRKFLHFLTLGYLPASAISIYLTYKFMKLIEFISFRFLLFIGMGDASYIGEDSLIFISEASKSCLTPFAVSDLNRSDRTTTRTTTKDEHHET